MKKNILIIGKRSFIGSNLFNFIKKKNLKVKSISIEMFTKLSIKSLSSLDIIINCSINKNYVKKKYKLKNDYDLLVAKKIKNFQSKLVIISTRKVYKPKFNISESDKVRPKCNYSKNKLKSEMLVSKILNNRLLILRVANIIGPPKKNKRKIHKTFSDIFFDQVKKGFIYKNKNNYKDFISIKKFCEMVFNLLKYNAKGIYNVSIGKKIYLNELVGWLNFYNRRKTTKIEIKKSFNNDNFTLNNKKLMNKIKTSNSLNEFKKECIKLSKYYFKK
mgnify:FL=1|tara:strand:+ start:8230 stop:9051 length:822 start_codon:yes stop_codon:yes gene_type:complete